MIKPDISVRILAMCLIMGLFTSSHAQVQKMTSSVDLNDLRITNRAQCAIDSQSPANSTFLVLDGFNPGKLTYMLASSIGSDGETMSKEGMKEFRLAISHLTLAVMRKLSHGELPLLPMNLKNNFLKNYQTVVSQCENKAYCAELNTYLGSIWALSERDHISAKSPDWKLVDTFTSASFLPENTIRRLGCYYLKRFSPLQGQLQNTSLDQAVLEEMAVAVLDQQKNITSCYDQDLTLDSRSSALQIDLNIGNQDLWRSSGYDYWNSLKIYISWAWRNTEIPTQMSPRFGEMFKSIALEESMMFIPNGCKSLTKPTCDSEHISLNSLRELAKAGNKPTNHADPSPQSPEQSLIENGARAVNDDFLGTRSFETAGEWVANFRKNFVQNRGVMKTRLTTAVQFMNIAMDSLSALELVEFVKPLALASNPTSVQRDELYYLCTEIRLAGDQRLNFMKSDIDSLSRLNSMERAIETSTRDMNEFVSYFDILSNGILPLCDHLEKENIWNGATYTVNKNGLFDWSKQILNITIEGDKATATPYISAIYGSPLLVWPQGETLCASGIECARLVVKSLVDLYSVSVYADAFLPISSNAPSPDLFNPYSELTACKIYDPWFQTKRANKRLISDLANTFAFGWTSLPIYMDNDFTPDRVTSFKSLIEQGKLQFSPEIDKGKMQTALVADFGPLAGAPCAISIAPNSLKSFDFYAFNGISVNYCKAQTSSEVEAGGPHDITTRRPQSYSYCGGCSLNFVGISSAASSSVALGLNPLKFGIYLFRSIHRFLAAKKDPVNVPKSYNVNLNYVAETYQRYGTIPKHCVEMLGQSLQCHESICIAKAAAYFESRTGGKISKIHLAGGAQDQSMDPKDSPSKIAWIRSDLCPGDITMPFQCRNNGSGFFVGNAKLFGVTEGCRGKKF